MDRRQLCVAVTLCQLIKAVLPALGTVVTLHRRRRAPHDKKRVILLSQIFRHFPRVVLGHLFALIAAFVLLVDDDHAR